jgi:acyl transferase domain-containing protein
VSSTDYGRVVERKTGSGISAYSATGSALSVVCGRISYTLCLKGPAVTVDTACSSSLVSLHMAFNSLLGGQALLALNSGVNLMLAPDIPAMFQRAGMLSFEGRCKTLDAAADGYVRGEAVLTCLLRAASSLDADFAANDTSGSTLLVRGTAVNQGGRSSTLTAPNGPSQQDVLRNALASASAEPFSISSLQMHGTGETAYGPSLTSYMTAQWSTPCRS